MTARCRLREIRASGTKRRASGHALSSIPRSHISGVAGGVTTPYASTDRTQATPNATAAATAAPTIRPTQERADRLGAIDLRAGQSRVDRLVEPRGRVLEAAEHQLRVRAGAECRLLRCHQREIFGQRTPEDLHVLVPM